MRKIICLLAAAAVAVMLCGCGSGDESKYPEPTERFFVNDFADVIEPAAEDAIYSRAVALQEKTTAQVVVVTVGDLGGDEPAQYALELGREWGVGQKGEDNGIVILLAEEEREIYIAVGYGLEGALPDSKTGRIIDRYGLEYLRNDNFSTGISEISAAIVNEVYIEYGVEPEDGYIAIDKLPAEDTQDGYGAKVAVSWVAMIAVVVLFVMIFGRRGRGFFWFGGPGGFGGHGGHFGGRGGFGGGGFSGGGFSGGGGSFGGGGAGRGF